ncbi:TetR family transcriptional regulator [Planosporangium flavigriseum]|uniref:TetR family transcriptional regulator n=1 Tax=Planosporangium flavigriseum TaxID=373681 RepID=A0A8J3LHY8_9ACTN|nr:TetR/AcrR family transcriptional regulator [Planosporangium flavigriseum]NJC65010.1 TetR family transcriptional regulator [Planosporangium flavigriseum]GIG71624.1 TetR family transcriptional regulator [Planosporangium flavigriseum]
MQAIATLSEDGDRVGGPGGETAASVEPPMGLRARKKLETFRALQSAARRLVGERGLANVTTEEIAEAANVSKRTFFNYFESKEAAIFDREPGRAERLADELAARPVDEPPLQALRAACVTTLRCYAHELQELTALVRAEPSLAGFQLNAFAGFEKVIVEWAAARTGTDPATDVYPALLAGVTNVMRQLTVARWRPETGDEGFLRLAEEIFDLLAGGLDPSSGVSPRR